MHQNLDADRHDRTETHPSLDADPHPRLGHSRLPRPAGTDVIPPNLPTCASKLLQRATSDFRSTPVSDASVQNFPDEKPSLCSHLNQHHSWSTSPCALVTSGSHSSPSTGLSNSNHSTGTRALPPGGTYLTHLARPLYGASYRWNACSRTGLDHPDAIRVKTIAIRVKGGVARWDSHRALDELWKMELRRGMPLPS